MKFSLATNPKFIRPEILCDPPLPTGLHRVNPRSIKGTKWWNIVREEAYKTNDYCCWACGVHTSEAQFYYRLEAHERFKYKYSYRSGTATLMEVAALCHACHNFIHIGRLKALVKKKVVTYDRYRTIVSHGSNIMATHGLRQTLHPKRVEKYPWPGWTLVFEGRKYKSPFKTYFNYVNHFARLDYSKEIK